MERYFELQYNIAIIALIILGVVVASIILFFIVKGIILFYKSHSRRYEYNCLLDEYVRKEDPHEKNRHDHRCNR